MTKIQRNTSPPSEIASSLGLLAMTKRRVIASDRRERGNLGGEKGRVTYPSELVHHLCFISGKTGGLGAQPPIGRVGGKKDTVIHPPIHNSLLNSSTVLPASPISPRSKPLSSSLCLGIDRLNGILGLVRIIWSPLLRT